MLLDKTISEINKLIKSKEITFKDLTDEAYLNIKKTSQKINDFITIIKDAKPGLPYVLKDPYSTAGILTTCASNVLSNYFPQYDATVYSKLKDAGMSLVGKMNMDAWGHGGSSENTDFGPVKNPWDLTRVAGGSSGGPAAAIAARHCLFAIGEDTGGSIRNPAAWCNITGLKVSYGRVSRYGCIAYASSFDTVGPMAKTAEDCAYVLEIIAGRDPYDATSANKPVPKYTEELKKDVKRLIIGVPKELYGKGLDTEIKQAIKKAQNDFETLGIEIKEISMPLFHYGVPVYYIIAPSETSSNLARYDGIRFGNGRENFTEETKRRIMVGTYALSAGYYDAYYKKAQQVRTLFIKEYEKALSQCDAILMPVNPTPPTKIGELINDPVQNLLADYYTTSQNPVGVPSLALPCGFTKSKLPIGMQLVGKMFTEDLLLRIGYHYQQITDWHKKKPEL